MLWVGSTIYILDISKEGIDNLINRDRIYFSMYTSTQKYNNAFLIVMYILWCFSLDRRL